MNRSRTRSHVRIVWLTGCLIALPLASISYGQKPETELDQIRNDWLQRRTRTRAVYYELSGIEFIPKGKLLPVGDDLLPPGMSPQPTVDHSSRVKITWEWDLAASLFCKQSDGEQFSTRSWTFLPKKAKYVLEEGVFKTLDTFAKDATEGGSPQVASNVIIHADKHPPGFLSAYDYPISFAHGVFPHPSWGLSDGYKDVSVDALKLTLSGKSRINDSDCAIVEITRTDPQFRRLRDRAWVDTSRQSAVVKWERYLNEVLFARLNISYQNAPSGWLPADWTVDFYNARENKPLELEQHFDVHVDKVLVNREFDRDSLTVNAEAGMILADLRESNTPYRIADDGVTRLSLRQRTWQLNRAAMIFGAICVACIAICGIVWVRRRT